MTTSAVNIQQQRHDESVARERRAKAALFDCWQTDTEIVLSGDFPGVNSDELSIEFHDHVLTIRGASDTNAGYGKLMRSEFDPGSFERSFRVHEEINSDGIKAAYDNAVLTVVLPIVQPVAPRRIPVSVP
jgi:HSP20 family molecular chaperone IbpA